ncbi:hypothetical protein BSP239C_01858 [Brevibacterium sp. 239c]|nr:hypothetical protein BSP239C_01858 [Brevibacterium sp. 239c]
MAYGRASVRLQSPVPNRCGGFGFDVVPETGLQQSTERPREARPSNAVGQAGGMLLTETVHTSGLGHHLKTALAPLKKPFVIHDPAKILLDLAITIGLGGDALSNTTAVRDEPDLYGPVASNPTITRIIHTLASDADRSLTTLNQARATARGRV